MNGDEEADIKTEIRALREQMHRLANAIGPLSNRIHSIYIIIKRMDAELRAREARHE